MKKLLYLFLTVLIVGCSDDDGNPCLYNPTLTTSAVTNITETSATLNGVISIASENCEDPTNTEQGFVYATTIQPTINNTQVNVNGTNISITLNDFEVNTTYYVRTFITNALGDFYGNEVSFIIVEQPCVYNLNTLVVTNITSLNATLNGIITVDDENCENPILRGFVYSTEIQPTIEDTQVNVNNYDGDVTTTLDNLYPNTTYYVRTFIMNTLGEFYGNEVSFMTENIPELLNCDGNPVPTIVYGTQEWTVEDFCMETFRDGTPIPQVQDNSEWGQGQSPKWAYYDNDPTQLKVYNYEAVRQTLFAPEGWHVPTAEEWTILEEYLIANGYNYDNTTTGNKIGKSMASTTGWSEGDGEGDVGYNQSINNSSGFNGIPTPYRNPSGSWCCAVGDGTNLVKVWWTNGPWNNEAQVPYRLLDASQPHIQNNDHQLPDFGFSVRLVKD